MKKSLIAAVLAAAFLSGCATHPAPVATVSQGSVRAAHELSGQLRFLLDEQDKVLVATIVDRDHLGDSSTIGRLITEQVGANLARDGVAVLGPAMRDMPALQPGVGEPMLSPEMRALAKQHQARVVLIGTYTEGMSKYFVNLKAVDLRSNTVIAAHSFEVSTLEFSRMRY
jgi:hypothetical protein